MWVQSSWHVGVFRGGVTKRRTSIAAITESEEETQTHTHTHTHRERERESERGRGRDRVDAQHLAAANKEEAGCALLRV